MRARFPLTIIFALMAGILILNDVFGNGMKISNKKALLIAVGEATKLGYEAEHMNVEAILYKTYWNSILPKDSTSEYDLERQNKLKGKIYWAVYFYPRPSREGGIVKGGDVCIFVDSTTGDILADYRGE